MAKGLKRTLAEASARGNIPGTAPATPSVRGTVLQGAAVPNAVTAPTKAEFDALLASLRAAGVIVT